MPNNLSRNGGIDADFVGSSQATANKNDSRRVPKALSMSWFIALKSVRLIAKNNA